MQDQLLINGILVDWQRAELIRGQEVVSIEPKLLAVLRSLVQANGNIVSQQQLLQAAWGETIVSANTIQRCITELRKLFKDDAKQQVVIQTHPKLGYSLVLSAVTPANAKKQPASPEMLGPWQKRLLLTIGLLTILFLISHRSQVASQSVPRADKAPVFTQISPITVHDERVDAFASDTNGTVYLAVQMEGGHRLIKQTSDGQQQQVLDKIEIYGDISLSPDGTYLAFARLKKQDRKKCAELIIFELASQSLETLVECRNKFNHTPVWADPSTLIYLSTDKQSESEIWHLTLEDKTPHPLLTQIKRASHLDMQLGTQQLLITADTALSVWHYSKSDGQLRPKRRHSVQHLAGGTASWFNPSLIAYAHQHSLYWFTNEEQPAQTPALNQAKLDTLKPVTQGALALFTQSDWSSRLRWLEKGRDTDIAPTKFREFNGQFRPGSKDIALLSDRSGSSRLYFIKDSTTSLIHTAHENIANFVWVLEGQGIVYVADGQLWLNLLGSTEQALTLEYEVLDVFQANDSQLLLQVRQDNQALLLSYDFTEQRAEPLLDGLYRWAQQPDHKTLIVATNQGQLQKFVDGKPKDDTELPDITIQARFLVRQAQGEPYLYVQDKMQNIWRYDNARERAEIIGQYDEGALFMTDFNPQDNAMLSDNFVSSSKALFLLKEE